MLKEIRRRSEILSLIPGCRPGRVVLHTKKEWIVKHEKRRRKKVGTGDFFFTDVKTDPD